MSSDTTAFAGFWVRVAASLVDAALLLAISLPILLAVYGEEYWKGASLVQGPVDLLVSWVLPAIAVVTFWATRQATPGKMLVRATIVDAATGGKPGVGQLIGRYIGYYVSTIVLMLGFVWIGLDRRKQGWHDKLAGTLVVRPVAPLSGRRRAAIAVGAGLGAIAVIAIFTAAFVAGARMALDDARLQARQALAEGFRKAAEESNRKGPRMVDSDTRLERASAGPGPRITYFYSLPRLSSREVSVDVVRENLAKLLRDGLCANAAIVATLNSGGIYAYVYSANDGVEIARFEFDRRACETSRPT